MFNIGFLSAETNMVTAETFSSVASIAGDGTTVITISSVINAREDNSSDDTTVYAVVISTLVIIIVVASVFTVIVCHFKKRTKSSKPCDVRPITTVTETIDSSGYNIINYNNMTGISIHEKEKNRHEINATNRRPEDIKTAIKQKDTICNKYESLSANRKSVEHADESDLIPTNHYQSLTKHTYESTEHALPQNIKDSIEQEDHICNKYESLSINRNSVEYDYESNSINSNQYQTFAKQQGSNKNVYESTEQALPQEIKTAIAQPDRICNKYESLSSNRNSVEHVYESDAIHTNQYESLTKQRESNKHTYESTQHASPLDIKTSTEHNDSICNKYE